MPVNVLDAMGDASNAKVITGETSLSVLNDVYSCTLDIDFEPAYWIIYLKGSGYKSKATGYTAFVYDGSTLCVLGMSANSNGVLTAVSKTDVPFVGVLDNDGYHLDISVTAAGFLPTLPFYIAVN